MTKSELKSCVGMALLPSLIMFSACASGPNNVPITSNPADAFVRINDTNVGTTPTNHHFDFKRSPVHVVVANKPGYLEEQIRLNKDHPMIARGVVEINLQEDEAYRMTTESEATNRWVRVELNSDLTQPQAWQRIIDSVTATYESIEQMDQTAGYLRTTPKVRMFQLGRQGNFRIRTHLVGSISSRDPVTYRFQVRSQIRPERAADHAWEDYDRIFTEDAQLIQELQMRLGR